MLSPIEHPGCREPSCSEPAVFGRAHFASCSGQIHDEDCSKHKNFMFKHFHTYRKIYMRTCTLNTLHTHTLSHEESLSHGDKLVRVPASACGAYDCSVCYDWYEASLEQVVAPGTADDCHPSVVLASWVFRWGSSLHWSWHCWQGVPFWSPPLQGCLLAHLLIFHFGMESTVEQPPVLAAPCSRALARFGNFWFWYGCRTEKAPERKTTWLLSWPEACTIDAACMMASVSALRGHFLEVDTRY